MCNDHLSCVVPSCNLRVDRWEHRRSGRVSDCGYPCKNVEAAQRGAEDNSNLLSGFAPNVQKPSYFSKGRDESDGGVTGGLQDPFIVSGASAALDYQFRAPPLMLLTEYILNSRHSPAYQPSPLHCIPRSGLNKFKERENRTNSEALKGLPLGRGLLNEEQIMLYLVPVALRLTQGCLDDLPEPQQTLQGLSYKTAASSRTARRKNSIFPIKGENGNSPAGDGYDKCSVLHPLSPPYHSVKIAVSPVRLQVRLWHVERLYNAVNLMQTSAAVPHRVLSEELKRKSRFQRERYLTEAAASTEPLQPQARGSLSYFSSLPMEFKRLEQESDTARDGTPAGRTDAFSDETASGQDPALFHRRMPLTELRQMIGVVERERSTNWRQVSSRLRPSGHAL